MRANVFGYENKVYSLYISKKSYNQTLNLLLIIEKCRSHYVFIKDLNRLMLSRTKHKDKKHYCMSCLQNFTTEEVLLVCIDDRFTLPSIILKVKIVLIHLSHGI